MQHWPPHGEQLWSHLSIQSSPAKATPVNPTRQDNMGWDWAVAWRGEAAAAALPLVYVTPHDNVKGGSEGGKAVSIRGVGCTTTTVSQGHRVKWT